MPKFVGDISFKRFGAITFARRASGIDQAVVRYRGAHHLLRDFISGAQFGSMLVDNEIAYQGLFLGSITNDADPVFPVVDFTYFGFLNGASSPPSVESSTSTQTASVTIGDLTMDIIYKSPETTYRWGEIETIPGDNPRYKGVTSGIDPKRNILRYSVTGIEGARRAVSIAKFTELLNKFSTKELVTSYTVRELVPGTVWECEATTQRLLFS